MATGVPAGINFNTTTRGFSGTPSAAGSGTITVTATNSAGSATWTVAYITSAAQVAPAFADDTGDAQDWVQNTAITPVTVPAATGNPTPTYAVVGSLPTGIAFDASTRSLSGTPTGTGSGTIRIRATNSQGSDDWTVTYSTTAALVAPAFADDTGDAQSWTVGTAITPVMVPDLFGQSTPDILCCGCPAGRHSVQHRDGGYLWNTDRRRDGNHSHPGHQLGRLG